MKAEALQVLEEETEAAFLEVIVEEREVRAIQKRPTQAASRPKAASCHLLELRVHENGEPRECHEALPAL